MDDGDADFLALVDALSQDDTAGVASGPATSKTVANETAKVSDLEKRIKELEAELAAKTSSQSVPASSATKTPKLFDLDLNIFSSKKADPVSKIKEPEKGLTLSDIGLSESSDDDDNDYPSSLSKTGRQLKRKLESRDAEEKELKKNAPAPCRRKNHAFKDLAAPTSAASQAAAAKKKQAVPSSGIVVKCEFSGYKIANPLLPAVEVGARIGDKRTCKLGQVVLLNSSFGKSDWATFGIIVQNLGSKTSAKGSQFSILKIVDLEDTTSLVTLFLFSGAHQECGSIQIGQAVVLLNPSILPKKDDKSGLSLSVNDSSQVVELGLAEEVAYCQGQTKSGENCKNVVNKTKNEYCVYHLKAAFQKVSSQRMDLQMNWSGVQPRLGAGSKMKEVADGFFYGGKMFSAPSAVTDVKKPKPKPFGQAVTKETQALIEESRELVRRQLSEEEKKTLARITAGNEELNRFVVTAGPGSKNLVRTITKTTEKKAPARFISPSELLKSQQNSMQRLMAEHKKRALENVQGSPTLGGLSAGALTFGEDVPRPKYTVPASPKSTNALLPSQARALAKLKQSGKAIQKTDPNRKPATLSAVARDHIHQVVSAVPPASSVKNTEKKVCSIQDDPEIQALLHETSKHDDLCKLGEMEFMDKYFHNAAAKETLEEQMEQTQQMEVSVITCKKCKYTATSLSERCFKEKHDNVRHKATKRFFQCKNCSKRKPSFNLLPSPCKSCGDEKFQRCGMLAYERKEPKLDNEILLLRGDESGKYLND